MRKHRNNKKGYNLEELYDIGSQYQDTEFGNIRSNIDNSATDRARQVEMDRSRSQMAMSEISIFSPLVMQKNTLLK